MKTSNLLIAVLLVILVVVTLCTWFYPSPHDFAANNATWNGMSRTLSEFKADEINNLVNLPAHPEQTALIAIPYRNYTGADLSSIKRFVTDGGTLLVMDDYGYGNSILASLGTDARFTNQPLCDSRFYYKNPSLPRITNFAPQVRDNGIDSIMINDATTIANATDVEAIAWTSSDSFLDFDGDKVQDDEETSGPFIIAARLKVGKGNVAIVADPSMMINGMLEEDDNLSFIGYLTAANNDAGTKLLVDYSHLPEAPIDRVKARLVSTREALANPYVLVVVIAVIVIITRFSVGKGEAIDGHEKSSRPL